MNAPGSTLPALGRVGVAVAGLAFAAFFGALGVAIVGSPMRGEPAWSAWLLRGFIALIFGAMTAGGLYFAAKAFSDERGPTVPPAVTGRCPACGEPFPEAAGGGACAACDFPRALAVGWHEPPREGVGQLLFGGALGAGVFTLGLFLAAGALFGDEKRPLVIIAYLALSLLLTAVGAGLCYGLVIALRDAWKKRGERAFAFRHDEGSRVITASARASREGLEMDGTAESWLSVEQAPAGGCAEVPPAARALARVVAALHARGEAGLSFVERRTWSLRAGTVTRDAAQDVHVDAPLPRGQVRTVDARDIVLQALGGGSLRDVVATAAISPDLAAALDTFAARLGAVEVDDRVVAVLTRVAGARVGAGPYRATG